MFSATALMLRLQWVNNSRSALKSPLAVGISKMCKVNDNHYKVIVYHKHKELMTLGNCPPDDSY